jgi:hypothetical protein
MTEFNDTERESKVKQENVKAQMSNFNKPTNPPAFPTNQNGYLLGSGMHLRDYFAAQALQGYISARGWHPDFTYPADFNFDAGKRAADAVSVSAYKWADAMLKAREA